MAAKDMRLPTGSGEKILRAIARYHLLTAEQILRLGIIGVTEKYVYGQLKHLSVNGYLQMSDSQFRGVRNVWALTEKGRHHLLEQGLSVDSKTHHKPPKSIMLAHRIAVNDVLIAFDLLARHEPRFVVLELVNETTLTRRAVKVNLSNGAVMGYAPDAWIHFAVDGKEGAVALEVDRGTEEQKVWRRKIDAILAYTADQPSLYEQQFGLPYLTMAVIAVPGDVPIELRARNLHHWTDMELKRLDKENWKTLFKVRPATPATDDPNDLLLTACWRHPGETEPTPLIGGLA